MARARPTELASRRLHRTLNTPGPFLRGMLVFLLIVGLCAAVLYQKVQQAFWENPFLNGLILAVLAIGILAGLIGNRLRVPAGAFLVPFALASVLSATGTVSIALPPWLLVIAFTLLGWNIGLGFTRAILLHARRALLPTVASIIALISFSGLLAGLLILALGIDPLTAYLSTSPGGLDSIAVIAASSKVDVAFVMTLQTARLILVTLIGPWLARFVADRT